MSNTTAANKPEATDQPGQCFTSVDYAMLQRAFDRAHSGARNAEFPEAARREFRAIRRQLWMAAGRQGEPRS